MWFSHHRGYIDSVFNFEVRCKWLDRRSGRSLFNGNITHLPLYVYNARTYTNVFFNFPREEYFQAGPFLTRFYSSKADSYNCCPLADFPPLIKPTLLQYDEQHKLVEIQKLGLLFYLLQWTEYLMMNPGPTKTFRFYLRLNAHKLSLGARNNFIVLFLYQTTCIATTVF